MATTSRASKTTSTRNPAIRRAVGPRVGQDPPRRARGQLALGDAAVARERSRSHQAECPDTARPFVVGPAGSDGAPAAGWNVISRPALPGRGPAGDRPERNVRPPAARARSPPGGAGEQRPASRGRRRAGSRGRRREAVDRRRRARAGGHDGLDEADPLGLRRVHPARRRADLDGPGEPDGVDERRRCRRGRGRGPSAGSRIANRGVVGGDRGCRTPARAGSRRRRRAPWTAATLRKGPWRPDGEAGLVGRRWSASSSAGVERGELVTGPARPAMPSGVKARRSRPAENEGPSARRTTTSAARAAHVPTAARARQVAGVWALRRSGAARTTSSRRPGLPRATGRAAAARSARRVGRRRSRRDSRAGLPPPGRRPAAAGRDGPAPPVGSALLGLAARGAAAAAQAHVVLGEDPVDEAVRPPRLLGQRADARAVVYFFVSSPASLARSAPVIRAPFLTVSATDPPRRCSCPTIVGPGFDVGQSKDPFDLRQRARTEHDAGTAVRRRPACCRARRLRMATGTASPEYVQ